MTGVFLIEVPYTCGDERPGASRGPARFLAAGLADRLTATGLNVTVRRVERDEPFRDSGPSSLADCRLLAPVVREALDAGRRPIVLAGTCDVSKGVLAGFEHSGCGVVWLDAHGDFNTPDTTLSGHFPGMCLALITGGCYQAYWATIGDATPIAEAATALVGVRDLDPAERERLERSAVRVVPWRDGRPQASLAAALDAVAALVREVYVHVDLDVLDPGAAPGVVDYPAPGGLSLGDVEEVVREVAARFRIKAASMVAYNPDRDGDGRGLAAGLRVIEVLARA